MNFVYVVSQNIEHSDPPNWVNHVEGVYLDEEDAMKHASELAHNYYDDIKDRYKSDNIKISNRDNLYCVHTFVLSQDKYETTTVMFKVVKKELK